MITGDYHHTALATAREVGMVSSEAPSVIIDMDSDHNSSISSSCNSSSVLAHTSSAIPSPASAPLTPSTPVKVPNSPQALPPVAQVIGSPQPRPLPPTVSGSPSDPCRPLLTPLDTEADPSSGLDRLRFVMGVGSSSTSLTAHHALTALAEGQAQSVITGTPFQYLLDHPDVAPLETVLRSVVVLARMQPQQKGQAVQLLTEQGLSHQHLGKLRLVQV